MKKLLDKDPNYIRAYNNLANLKTSYNDYDGAIDLYKKAITLSKKNKQYYKNHYFRFYVFFSCCLSRL